MADNRLIVGMPFIESAATKVGELLESYIPHVDSVAIPLPKSLCYEIAIEGLGSRYMNPEKLRDIALRYMSESHLRVWKDLISKIPSIARKHPDKSFNCYLSDQSYKKSQEIGFKLAELVLRYRITSGKGVKPVEWLKIYSSRESYSKLLKALKHNDLVVLDEYRLFDKAQDILKPYRMLLAKKPLIPTPIDLLDLVLEGEINLENISRIAEFIARYLGDYIVTSRSYDEAYRKLLNDREYMKFIDELDLNIYD